MATSTRAQPLLNWSVALLATMFALLIAEGIVRVLGLAPGLQRIGITSERGLYRLSNNPILGYEPVPRFVDEGGEALTNSLGFRDRERAIAKPPGRHRIVLLGDSVAVSGTRLDDMIHLRLEKLFAPRDIDVINLAVAGYCTLAEVERLRVRGLAFEPDVVLVLFVENDFTDFNSEVALAAPTRWAFAAEWSHLLRLTAIQSGMLRGDHPVERNLEAIGDNNVWTGFAMLRDFSQAHGFEVRIAIWPNFEDDRIDDRPLVTGSTDPLVERIAAMQGLPTFRLSTTFVRHWRESGRGASPNRLYTLGDHMHPNSLGAEIAALALKQVLEQSLPRSARQVQPVDPDVLEQAARERSLEWDTPIALRHAAAIRLGEEWRSFTQNSLLPRDAIRLYLAAVQAAPESYDSHIELGVLLALVGDAGEAMEYLERAAALGAGCEAVTARALAALALIVEQQTERGLEQLRKVTPEALACGFDRRADDIGEQPPAEATARAYELLKEALERRTGSPLSFS
jgi:hypothetical protein